MERGEQVARRAVDETLAYFASAEGRELRRRVAVGLAVSAPLLLRLRPFRGTLVGRLVGLAGGAALIVKAAEWLRDWEPVPLSA